MPCCYILYSEKLNRFYIGSTHLDFDVRMVKHKQKFYSNKSFTAKASDWELFLKIEASELKLVMDVEKHIKKMKSKNYIINLKKYPEMIDKLLIKQK